MKRQITGLHAADRCAADQVPDSMFLVRVQRVYFRRHAQKPTTRLVLSFWSPAGLLATSFRAGSITIRKPCGN